MEKDGKAFKLKLAIQKLKVVSEVTETDKGFSYLVTPVKFKKHPKCLGDGFDDCVYNSKVTCDECRFNNYIRGGKDPSAKCNQF